MKLEGIHHVTAITADAQEQRRLLRRGARAAAGEEVGQPGRHFRLPPVLRRRDRRPGLRHHVLRVPGRAARARRARGWSTGSCGGSPSPEALDFWAERLADAAATTSSRVTTTASCSTIPRASTHELRVVETTDEPLIAEHPEIPAELALQGFHAVRAYAADPERSRALLEDTLGFVPFPTGPTQTAACELRGERRGGFYLYDPPPAERGLQGAGSVHHVAWASPPEDQEAWHSAGARGAAPAPRRSSTATTSARSTSASRRACCSRSRRSAPGSRSTSRSSSSARSSR